MGIRYLKHGQPVCTQKYTSLYRSTTLLPFLSYNLFDQAILEMASAQKYVDDLIKSKKVVMFSKSYCPFCHKAKRVFAQYNLSPDEYVVVELDQRKDGAEIQQIMKKMTGASSVPRVFINGKFIGGGDETVALDKQGKIKEMLAA